MLVHDILEQAASRCPDKVAVICGDQRLTYHQINRAADRMAAHLIQMGVRRHDRVALLLENSMEAIIGLFGILKAGAVFIMLNATMRPVKLNYVLRDSGAGVLMTHLNKYRVVKEALPDGAGLHTVIWCGGDFDNPPMKSLSSTIVNFNWTSLIDEQASEELTSTFPTSIDIDLSNIIYTSGSTGDPKGVMASHLNVIAATRSISTYLEMTAEDIVMNVLPLSFDYGLYQVFLTFFVRGRLLLEKSFLYPYKVLEKLVAERATGFPIVPTMAALLLQMSDLEAFDFKALRYISNTAAALPMAIIRDLRNLFPATRIFSMYGLTECKRVSYLPPEDIDRKPESVGIPMPNVEVSIVDKNGQDLGTDRVGELVIRGANVMQGYWNDPITTAKVFRKGRYPGDTRLYSGDLFKKDQEGYLYFIARKDDLINTKGERVSPREIEESLYAMAGVAAVVVFAVPDKIHGQDIVASIVCDKGATLSERQVKKYCRRHLEPFMVPRYVAFRDHFPISASGKIDKKLVAKEYHKQQ